ncbi:uncharacterized protein LOC128554645 isoform X2 [Mercenaria mercenaria]|uniref:uncharacterized protein LOC128554645 isoform X2 n=1 Tax=Mercenaria mercenaria TaxID=6596 RepID=UPI00234F5398|nr:uncharacterized protein LOC128554645 isoform X2 [Mercenaria mercenaria]
MARKELLTGLICSTLFLVSILLSLAVYWRELRTAPVEPKFCYFDEGLSSDNRNIDSNKQYCCKASDVLLRMVEKKTAEKYNNNANPEYPSFNPATFNSKISKGEKTTMQLKHIGSHAKPVPGQPTKIFWNEVMNSPGELRHLKKEGAIYIQKSGRYYISTQLTTRRENTTTHNDDQTVKHLVYLISADKGTEHILLENAISACELTVQQSEQSSNIGAVFELKEKNRIYVATSHPYHIVSGPGRDHFSIHKL